MADGYARISGRPQAVIAHVDVGTQALGQGVHNANTGRVPVLIFAGDQDLICNYVGLENTIQALTWNGATGLGVRPTPFFDFF